MNNIELLVKFYLLFCSIVVILAVSLYVYTNKYKNERIKIFGLFLNLDKRECLLLSCNLLTLIVTTYSLIAVKNFNYILISMLLTISIVSIIFSLNIHLIISEIMYSSITIIIIKLLNLMKLFLIDVNFDYLTYSLSVIFTIIIFVYSLFVFIRKTELLLRKNKFVGRNS